MSTLSTDVQEIINFIDSKDLSEADYNALMGELIDLDPDFQDLFDRAIDEVSTRIPELKNLRPQAKLMRNEKIFALMFWEYIEKRQQTLERDIFPSTAEEDGLIEHGRSRGITRKQKVKATGRVLLGSALAPDKTYKVPQLTIVGSPGSSEEESLQFLVDSEVLIVPGHPQSEDGNYWVEVNITAEEGGGKYNLEAGRITEYFTELPYFDLIKQESASNGGYDLEPLEDFRQRVLANTNTDFVPTYIFTWFYNKAMSFPGVSDVILIPLIHGECTLGVILKGTGQEVSQSVVDEVQAFFDDPGVRALGWKAFVMAVTTTKLDISCTIYYDDVDKPIELSEAYKAVEDYFADLEIGESYTDDKFIGALAKLGEDPYNKSFSVVEIASPVQTEIIVNPEYLITKGALNISVELKEN